MVLEIFTIFSIFFKVLKFKEGVETGIILTSWNGLHKNHPVHIYLFKVSNRNTWKRCEICSKLTIKTPGRSAILWFTQKALWIKASKMTRPYILKERKSINILKKPYQKGLVFSSGHLFFSIIISIKRD